MRYNYTPQSHGQPAAPIVPIAFQLSQDGDDPSQIGLVRDALLATEMLYSVVPDSIWPIFDFPRGRSFYLKYPDGSRKPVESYLARVSFPCVPEMDFREIHVIKSSAHKLCVIGRELINVVFIGLLGPKGDFIVQDTEERLMAEIP